MTKNVAAFLAMLRHSEGTDRPPAPENAYRCCYGFHHVIADLRDHPAITGEWGGERITRGVYAGELSTAAGAYQINHPTWNTCKKVLFLNDFTAPSQDDAAIYLIKQQGALILVNNGQVADAIARCHPVWASLPGSGAGQPITPMASLIEAYGDSGGAFA